MKTTIAIILMFVLSACSSMNGNINKGVEVGDVLLRGGSEVPKWFFDYPKDSEEAVYAVCLLYTSPSPRDATLSRMPSSA